jgi:hypothetical protein
MIFVIGRKHAASAQRMLEKMGEKSFIVGEIRKGARGARISS